MGEVAAREDCGENNWKFLGILALGGLVISLISCWESEPLPTGGFIELAVDVVGYQVGGWTQVVTS